MKIFFILPILLLTACALGPAYVPAPTPEGDKALVYLMRGDVYLNGGYPTEFTVNDKIAVKLYDFGYSWIHLPPGTHKIKANGRFVEATIEPGKTYYFEFHQKHTQMPSGKLVSTNSFREVQYPEIEKQLLRSRYKESADLSTAETAKSKDFIQYNKTDSATIRFDYSGKSRATYPIFSALIYDNYENCKGGHQNFTVPHLSKDIFSIKAGQPATFAIRATEASSNYVVSCRNIFTFTPTKGKSYEIITKAEKNQALKNTDSCIVTIKDRENNIPVELLTRSEPPRWTSNSAECKASDFKFNQSSTSSSVNFNCRVKFGGKWIDC
ncbi:hypothetical protein [Microbulbifer sp. JMSA008]|uniref:hypothetical protein n=1 Tax=unclassified Microbulbifer TaxID=2619833 RepID=UPI00403B1E12